MARTLETLLHHMDTVQYVLLLLGGGLLALLERGWPRRQGQRGAPTRWVVNLGLYGAGVALMATVFGPLQDAAIRLGSAAGWGGLVATAWPGAVKIALGVLLVDLVQFGLHWLAHAIPLLWRLHQVHHADEAMDVSTSVRHHPLEVIVLASLTLMLCAALGVPLLALALYAVLQLAHTLFCHANIALPPALDRWLRLVLVTPDMHRVHHSVRLDEGNANFGMVFPWWDHLFRTYCAQPAQGHQAMRLGLADGEGRGEPGLWRALWLPFAGRER